MTVPRNLGILGGFPPLSLLATGGCPSVTVYSTAATYSYQVPLGVTRVMVELWGGGQGSTATAGNLRIGASADYVLHSFAVTPGEYLSLVVGAGSASSAALATDSTVTQNGSVICRAKGGNSVSASSGDLVLAGGLTCLFDTTTLDAQGVCLNVAPRGASPDMSIGLGVAATVLNGTWPGGGSGSHGGAAAGTGAAGGIILYVPQPVLLT